MNSICLDHKIYEVGVGVLEHEFWGHGNNRSSSRIRICKQNGEKTWGDVIFEGTLKDLIEKIDWQGVTA